MSTGTIIVNREDDPRSEYAYQVRLDTDFGDAYILLEAVRDRFAPADVVFDCEGSCFYALVYSELVVADLVAALQGAVHLISSYSNLRMVVWA